jgi:hypothetical protein
MRTERPDPLFARLFDAHKLAPIRLTGNRLDLDGFARQRIGHEYWPVRRIRHAVTAMANAIDRKPFSHASLRVKILDFRLPRSPATG